MEPAQSSETTMSERPYLTFRNASRRARGRGMARVATRPRARRCVLLGWMQTRNLAARALLTIGHSRSQRPQSCSNYAACLAALPLGILVGALGILVGARAEAS